MNGLMEKYGEGGDYGANCDRISLGEWGWKRTVDKDSDCAFIQRTGFWGTTDSTTDDAAVVVWRLGRCDLKVSP